MDLVLVMGAWPALTRSYSNELIRNSDMRVHSLAANKKEAVEHRTEIIEIAYTTD